LHEGSLGEGCAGDDWLVEQAVRLIVGSQQRLDPLSQGEIGATFTVGERRSVGEVVLFDGREEHGLDAFGINRHGNVLQWGLPYHATFAVRAVEKSRKLIIPNRITKPGTGIGPLLASQVDGDPQGGRDLLVAQAGELAELDHPSGKRVFLGQPHKGLVQDKEFVVRVRFSGRLVVKFNAAKAAASLPPRLVTGRFNQDPAHRLGGGGKEMAATVPVLDHVGIDQSDIGLVDQGGGLERVARFLPRQLLTGELAEFLIDQGQELLSRLGLALFDRREDASYVFHRNGRQ